MTQNQDPIGIQQLEMLQKLCSSHRDQLLDRFSIYEEVTRSITFYQGLEKEGQLTAEQVLIHVSDLVKRWLAVTNKEYKESTDYLDMLDRKCYEAGIDIVA
jgi:hypothetical protein